MSLNAAELDQYAPQLQLEAWGEQDQAKLAESAVLVVGAGALGSVVGGYLTGAGVGRLGIVDGMVVEASTPTTALLQFAPDLGVNRAEALAAKLSFLNPLPIVEPYPVRLESGNADAIVAGHDFVLDCSNDEWTAAALNQACLVAEVPFSTAGFGGLRGFTLARLNSEQACATCLQTELQLVRQAKYAGQLGPICGLVGSWQALTALRALAALQPDPPMFIHFDLSIPTFKGATPSPAVGCSACGCAQV